MHLGISSDQSSHNNRPQRGNCKFPFRLLLILFHDCLFKNKWEMIYFNFPLSPGVDSFNMVGTSHRSALFQRSNWERQVSTFLLQMADLLLVFLSSEITKWLKEKLFFPFVSVFFFDLTSPPWWDGGKWNWAFIKHVQCVMENLKNQK